MDNSPTSAAPTPEDEDRDVNRPEPHISIVTARRNGLKWTGKPGDYIGGIPAGHDLTGEEVAAWIGTRAMLLAILKTPLYEYIPDVEPAAATAPAKPKRVRKPRPSRVKTPKPAPVALESPSGAPAATATATPLPETVDEVTTHD